MNFNWFSFSQLKLEQLYSILALRAEIFVVEQQCPYLDPDGKDFFAIHLLGMYQSKLTSYLRLFPPNDIDHEVVFGRVITARSARGQGYGRTLMKELLNYCGHHFKGIPIKCSAQHYLIKFYESFGFESYGKVYMEDNIPHIAMQKRN